MKVTKKAERVKGKTIENRFLVASMRYRIIVPKQWTDYEVQEHTVSIGPHNARQTQGATAI